MGGKQKTKGSVAATYALSSSAACIAESVTFPFDMIKTRLQVQGEGLLVRPGLASTQQATRGLFATGVGIVREEGFIRLYRGLAPACLRHVVYSGARVMIYEVLRENVLGRDVEGRFPLFKGMLAGIAAGALGQFVASPTDLVKVQLQLDGQRRALGLAPRHTGMLAAFASIYRKGGVRGLWKGWVPNCQRAGLVQLGDLTTYDAAKQLILRRTELEEGALVHAMSSGCAGLVAATLGAPADVVKTRFMNQPVDKLTGRGSLYTSSWQCLKVTLNREGIRALYKGWLPTWMRMAPWSLTFFLTFEQLRDIAGLQPF
jgi:solute carrier family 25 uncoupling protein 27